MLNTLISLGLESIGKQSFQVAHSLRSSNGANAGLEAYPVLRTALLRAERRGALAAERRSLLARLGMH